MRTERLITLRRGSALGQVDTQRAAHLCVCSGADRQTADLLTTCGAAPSPDNAAANPPRPLNDAISSASLGRFPRSLCTQGHLVSDQ